MFYGCVSFITLMLLSSVIFSEGMAVSMEPFTCEYYNPPECKNKTCNTTEVCTPPAEGKRAHCYSLWLNDSTGIHTELKGCWLDNKIDCYDRILCIADEEKKKDNDLLFCCCDQAMCNAKTYYHPKPRDQYGISNSGGGPGRVNIDPHSEVLSTLLYSLVPLISVAILVIVLYWIYKRHRASRHTALPLEDPLSNHSLQNQDIQENTEEFKALKRLEIKARGRYGCVWRAQLHDQQVAVKTFPIQDQKSWVTETEIYRLPHVSDSQDMLRFIGAERHSTNDFSPELWLITEFHPHGSLCDFLKGNLISWKQLLGLAESMSRGLAFLHDDIPASGKHAAKPAVAHRDFKSKNVLVKPDLTACIGDFGLALKFELGKNPGDDHGQVGTRRYMAPEVLEGAISFNRDAFLRIDMYACGLVLWELLSRCSGADGPVSDYQLPFEEEAGLHPTLDDMQDIVVHKKLRPTIKPYWFNHTGLSTLIETMNECWDQDAEARLSAQCVQERINQLDQQTHLETVFLPSQPQSDSQLTEADSQPKESSM